MNVVEAEATSTPEAGTTAKTPAVVAAPQEGEGAKAGVQAKTEAKPAAQEAKPEAKTEVAKGAAKGEAKPEAPEASGQQAELAFTTPEGEPIKGPVIEAFTAMAKERKWTQEIADQELGRLSQSMTTARTALTAEWDKELRADKDIGGSKFDENLGAMRKAVERVGGVAAYEALVKDGLDRHPPTVRLLHAFAQAISPDGFTAGVNVPGRPGQIPSPNDTSVASFREAFKLKT